MATTTGERSPLAPQHPATPRLDGPVLALPPNAPKVRHNRFTRWLGRTILRLGGWRMVGEIPDIPKLVLIAAPHSSNWDALWGFAVKLAMGLKLTVLGKHQLFWWPLGVLMRRLGVIAVDRKAAHGVADQVAALIADPANPRLWVAIAPEGTRKPVERWKPGFWKIAHAAGVPVLPAYFHYPDKVIGIGPPIELSDDMTADIARIRAWYRPWQGKHHGTL